MTAITISRQYGSLGCSISNLVGEKLGYRVIYRDLINQAAVECDSPEVALSLIDELGLLGLSPSPKALESYRCSLSRVMSQLADEGNVVIIGRAGQSILRDRKDVIHVRVIAPLDVRIKRTAARQNISEQAALAQIKASDNSRKQFLKRLFKVSWEEPAMYHLVLNTGFLPLETAADMISLAVSNIVYKKGVSIMEQENIVESEEQRSP
jgi:CMP/dCMP kinase